MARLEAEDMQMVQKPGYGMCPKVATVEAEGISATPPSGTKSIIFYNWDLANSQAGQALVGVVPVDGLQWIIVNATMQTGKGEGWSASSLDPGIDIYVDNSVVGHLVVKAPTQLWSNYRFGPVWLRNGQKITLVFNRSGNWVEDIKTKIGLATFIDYVEFTPAWEPVLGTGIGASIGGAIGYFLKEPLGPMVSEAVGAALGGALGGGVGLLTGLGIVPIPQIPIPTFGAPPEGPVAPARLGKYQITG